MALNGNAVADVKLGFWIGVGILLLGVVLGLFRMLVAKAR